MALLLRPNVLLETGRTSYSGVIQLLPRTGGIRECIVARPGYALASVDYEAGELITHGQNCIDFVGFSKLAESLNAGIKVHNQFASSILGITYDEYQKRFKAGDKRCKNVRQASKPANFGFPGRMGAAKLVLQQRKQGPDTPCENGPALIVDDDGNEVRGYRGLRFCILMDNATSCGDVKIKSHKDRDIPPTCEHCIECAERLREKWFAQWPENRPYFDLIKEFEEDGQSLADWQIAAIGETCLAPGEVLQHRSLRIRGGATGNALANGFFQGLLADAAKAALREVTRACWDRTVGSVLYGSRVILFAHDELIAEVPLDRAHECAYEISRIMVKWLRVYCPDLAPACAAEPAIALRWYKSMAPVIHGDRLVPWTPEHKAKACQLCKEQAERDAARKANKAA